jgi:hypothetical protein
VNFPARPHLNHAEGTFSLAGRDWRAFKGASESEVALLRATLPFKPPQEYVALLRLSNGGEGELALPPLWFQLYDIKFAIQLWEDQNYRREYPNLFFGSNGGLESIALEMSRSQPWPVVMVDCIAAMESARTIAQSMKSFLVAVGVRSESEA